MCVHYILKEMIFSLLIANTSIELMNVYRYVGKNNV